jgi:hypothetical protein
MNGRLGGKQLAASVPNCAREAIEYGMDSGWSVAGQVRCHAGAVSLQRQRQVQQNSRPTSLIGRR